MLYLIFSSDQTMSLSEAIKSLRVNLLHPDEGLLDLEVRRDFLVADAMREARKNIQP